jgi:hypothetical protein
MLLERHDTDEVFYEDELGTPENEDEKERASRDQYKNDREEVKEMKLSLGIPVGSGGEMND